MRTSTADAALAAVLRLARQRSPACGSVSVVAVDGPSGSGKSTLGIRIAAALTAPLIPMDDLYPGWDGLAAAVPLLVDQVLDPLACSAAARYRRWDWGEHQWDGTVDVPASPHVVVEGVGSSVRPAGDYAAVRVWVEADVEVRMARGIARDGEAYRPHWQRWQRQEQALFTADATRRRADVLLDTTAL